MKMIDWPYVREGGGGSHILSSEWDIVVKVLYGWRNFYRLLLIKNL